MTTLEKVISDYLGQYDFTGKNILEFGPCIKENRLTLMKATNRVGGTYYALDHCSAHTQTPEEARELSKKYDFELDIIDYNETIDYRVKEVTTKQSLFFKEEFYDVIFARCSWHTKYSATTRNLMTLCNMIGRKDCKVILIPWFNDENLSAEHYIKTFEEIDYESYGFQCERVEDGIYNYKMIAPTLVISKNVSKL